jgi:hypothetical protein
MWSHANVVEAFGGTAALARAIDVSPKLTIHWGRRGIPARYWHRVEATELGRKLGITAARLSNLPATASELEAA